MKYIILLLFITSFFSAVASSPILSLSEGKSFHIITKQSGISYLKVGSILSMHLNKDGDKYRVSVYTEELDENCSGQASLSESYKYKFKTKKEAMNFVEKLMLQEDLKSE